MRKRARLDAFPPSFRHQEAARGCLAAFFNCAAIQETDFERVRWRASRGDEVARDALVVLDNIRSFALWPELQARGCSPHSLEHILRVLFGAGGLGYHERPKGLVPFHLYDDGVRSAFAEHLNEAAKLTADEQKNCDVHFTIGELHVRQFESERDREAARFKEALGVRCRVTFSVQSHDTDAIATDLHGKMSSRWRQVGSCFIPVAMVRC